MGLLKSSIWLWDRMAVGPTFQSVIAGPSEAVDPDVHREKACPTYFFNRPTVRNEPPIVTEQVTIRGETPGDYEPIAVVNRRAFGQENEGLLIAKLRGSDGFDPSLSLVGEIAGDVVGHVLFSPIHIETERGDVPALALAPMAVLPNFQKRGIGSQLVRTGLDISRQAGHAIIVVLGHPDYYPRFGFQQASQFGVRSPFDVPDDVFMVQGLIPGALDAVMGVVRYPGAFDGV